MADETSTDHCNVVFLMRTCPGDISQFTHIQKKIKIINTNILLPIFRIINQNPDQEKNAEKKKSNL